MERLRFSLPLLSIRNRFNTLMPKQIHYNAAEHISPDTAADPYLRPAFSLRTVYTAQLEYLLGFFSIRTSPRPLHSWRSFLLRLFGATIGRELPFLSAVESLGALEFDLCRSSDSRGWRRDL